MGRSHSSISIRNRNTNAFYHRYESGLYGFWLSLKIPRRFYETIPFWNDVAWYRIHELEELNQKRAAAIEHAKLIQADYKFNYDKTIVKRDIKVGDLVLMKNQSKKKFELDWLGPFKVLQKLAFGTYKIVTLDTDLVHGDCLKLAKTKDQEGKTGRKESQVHSTRLFLTVGKC